MDMNDRKRRVLTAIVQIYAAEGEPVGSNLLSRRLGIRVSPATLRNEMAALTQLGLLMQPHTSAGRVPSMAGYRYYLQNLMTAPPLSPADRRAVDELFDSLGYDRERLIQNTAAALAELTGHPVIATTPYNPEGSIAHFEAVQVGRYDAALLGVSRNGEVSTRVAQAGHTLTKEALSLLTEVLNRNLTFVPPKSLTRELAADILQQLGVSAEPLAPLASAAVQLVADLGVPRLYVEGQERLLDFPELDDSLRGTVAFLGDRPLLMHLLAGGGAGTRYLWGDEVPGYYLPDLCVVCAGYQAGGGAAGTLALAGPARMEYPKMVPLLRYCAQVLSHMITAGIKEDEP